MPVEVAGAVALRLPLSGRVERAPREMRGSGRERDEACDPDDPLRRADAVAGEEDAREIKGRRCENHRLEKREELHEETVHLGQAPSRARW
jgi:hypothetical protein